MASRPETLDPAQRAVLSSLDMSLDERLVAAAEVVSAADALFIGAGAGMGVDSGLPDFRGTEGFWRAYPAYAKLGKDFAAMANPRWFTSDPTFAWGFYGHRLALYRATVPHVGFGLLGEWAERREHGAFVVTSNVDGQFQRAGFAEDRIVEIHGSIHRLQCVGRCPGTCPAEGYAPDVDPETMRAREPLPRCADCGGLMRPNILMFGDGGWDSSRTDAQEARLDAWLGGVAGARIAVLECGAGTAIPSIRHACERMARRKGSTLVRVNVREPEAPPGSIELPLGAAEALARMNTAMR
jgi:NAD-dependent SIR2 family protein deacetylase